MKATELMIGDWVMRKEVSLPLQIRAIRSEKYCPNSDNYIGTDYAEDWSSLSYYSPIPLTAEILEKNGWIEYHIENNGYCSDCDYYYHNKNLPLVYAKITGKEDMIYLNCHIKYIHELQHALRLCGMNELADNFKI